MRLTALALIIWAPPVWADKSSFADLPTGRCSGAAGSQTPPKADRPYDLRADPQREELTKALVLAGYRVDEASGQAFDAKGRPLSAAEYAWLSDPVDFSHEHASMDVWVQLMMSGYRLDETSCVLHLPGGQPLTRFDYLVTRENARREMEHMTLEDLKLQFDGLGASAPDPRYVRDRLKLLSQAGVTLPAGLQKTLAAPRSTVGALARGVDAAYLELTKFFDGQRTQEDLVAAAKPASGDLDTVRQNLTKLEPEERRLGDLFEQDMIRRFSADPAGRELLDHFRGNDGQVHLPPTIILKAAQRSDDPGQPGAYFTYSDGVMTFNHWQAVSLLLEAVTADDRSRLAKEFSDPAALRRYLETHPKERDETLGVMDEMFYHEFIHAWQGLRDRYNIERMRGNVPLSNPLAREHEAYREQCRYDFSKARQDPASLAHSGYRSFCLGMVKDYDSFCDYITGLYLGTFGGGEELSVVSKIQQLHKATARRLMSDSLLEKARQQLKLEGLSQGDEVINDFQKDYAQREAQFLHERLPAIRRDVLDGLVPVYVRDGPADLSKELLDAVPPATPGYQEARRKWAADAAPLVLKPRQDFTLQFRVSSYKIFLEESRAGRLAWTAALQAAYLRDVREYVRWSSSQALAMKDSTLVAAWRETARNWSRELPPGDPLRVKYGGESKRSAGGKT